MEIIMVKKINKENRQHPSEKKKMLYRTTPLKEKVEYYAYLQFTREEIKFTYEIQEFDWTEELEKAYLKARIHGQADIRRDIFSQAKAGKPEAVKQAIIIIDEILRRETESLRSQAINTAPLAEAVERVLQEKLPNLYDTPPKKLLKRKDDKEDNSGVELAVGISPAQTQKYLEHLASNASAYRDESCNSEYVIPKILKCMSEGMSKSELLCELGVSDECLFRWMRVHPEINLAMRQGMELCKAYWERMGRTNLMNPDFNANLWVTNMINRFAWNRNTASTTVINQFNQTTNNTAIKAEGVTIEKSTRKTAEILAILSDSGKKEPELEGFTDTEME
jgi:hypothetical protein